ncbi:dolichol-P-glucose synthetase [Candidatus Woesearchaeota archaeon B3_Woes]|nr:MAG: dolichol-P-glucose synthetase [Candidatus Woesearchaeota archaeon B3_Woes]
MGVDIEFSLVLPCLNEEKTIGICIEKAKKVFSQLKVSYEIIVVDNGCKDNSASIAKKLGAKVVVEPKQGYGNAYLKGFSVTKGNRIIMVDSDNTYDLYELPKLIQYSKKYDLVLGKRTYFHKKAMPWLHRTIGNPLLSFIFRLFFKAKIKDVHSGFRIIKKTAFEKLELNTGGMEFASEMLMKAVKQKIKVKEVLINYYKRIGKSKLSSFNDGWKHLRFMLLHTPSYLFFIPGFLIFFVGILGVLFLSTGDIMINNFRLGIHTAILCSLLAILGFQLIFLTLFAKIYLFAVLKEKSLLIERFIQYLTLEKGLFFGSLIFLIGLLISGNIFIRWLLTGFSGFFQPGRVILASTILIIGIQIIFNVFYLSILGIEKK